MPTSTNSTGPIMDVWQNNLDVEMAKIRSVVQQYPFIAMVCETTYLFVTATALTVSYHECCFRTQ